MGILSRLSLIVRGYISSAGDRLDSLAAEEELRSAQSRRQAREELAKALEKIDSLKQPAAPIPPRPRTPTDKLAPDYRLLGLNTSAGLVDVEAAWRRLASRADPKHFPAGSEEERKAAEILGSLNEAYARIREVLNPTEGRFGQLEL